MKLLQSLKKIKPYLTKFTQNKMIVHSFNKNISVFRNPKGREDKEIKKLEEYWEKFDKEIELKQSIEAMVEKKYKDDTYYVGRHINKDQEIDKEVMISSEDTYFIPLTAEDENLLVNFSSKSADDIRKGGRLVLFNELKKHNAKNTDKIIQYDDTFEPMSKSEVENLIKEHPEIHNDDKLFNFALQKGQQFLKQLQEFKQLKTKSHSNYLNKIRYVEHYHEVNGRVPFNNKISQEFPIYEDPFYVKLLLLNKDTKNLQDQLKDIYFSYYNWLINLYTTKDKTNGNKVNYSFESFPKDKNVQNVLEENFYDRSLGFIDYLMMNNLQLSFEKDTSGNAPKDSKYYIFEKMLFKGVYVNRYNNYEPNDYIHIDAHENDGIRYYIHKYMTGEVGDYLFKRPANGVEEQDPHVHGSFDYIMKIRERNKKLVLRVYMFIQHPHLLKVRKVGSANDKSDMITYSKGYNYNHLAVFENELIQPGSTFLAEHDFNSWIRRQKLDNSKWKLVDLDNFMNGNPFFIKKTNFQYQLEILLSDPQQNVEYLKETFPEYQLKQTFLEDAKGGKKSKKDKKEKKDTADQTKKAIEQLSSNYRVTKLRQVHDDEEATNEKKMIEDAIKLNEAKYTKENEKLNTNLNTLTEALDQQITSPNQLDNLAKLITADKNSLKVNIMEIKETSETERLVEKDNRTPKQIKQVKVEASNKSKRL